MGAEHHASLHRVADAILSEDDAGRPVVLRVGVPLHPANQRLMDSLGVQVVVVTQPVVGARSMGDFMIDGVTEPFEPNLIDFRHSVVLAHKRAAADDETLEICPHCMCEVDVDPAPHRPGCVGIGKSRASSGPVLAREDWPAQQKKDEKAAVETAARLSLGEEAAVGQTAVSSSAAAFGELERVASSPSAVNPYGLKKFGRGYIWTRTAAESAVQAFATEHGRPPRIADSHDAGPLLPSQKSASRLYGNWDALIEAAGLVPDGGRGHARAGASGRPRSATRTPSPQPEVEEQEEATSEEREPDRLGPDDSRSSDADLPPDITALRQRTLDAVRALFALFDEVEAQLKEAGRL